MDIRAGTTAMREKRLYEAALCGSVESLHELMREDKLTLARVSLTCFNETHLHIAAMLGHTDFVKALLSYSSSDLVTKLDDHGRTPMHLASGAGRVEVVRLLVAADADVCLVQDEDGRTPLHLAAMHGHLDVVRELIKARPQVVSTRYMLERGETILQTCVVHNRLEVLKVLMSMVTMDDDFLNFKDDNGYTILHTSAALKHKEIIRYLVSEGSGVRVDAKNENGFTALDMMDHMPRDMKTMEIIDLLVKAGAGRRDHQLETRTSTEPAPNRNNSTVVFDFFKNMNGKSMWSKEMREGIMVAATLIAGIAYQATISPPGGVWQEYRELEMWDHHSNRTRNATVVPGTSVMGIYYPSLFATFWALNTVSFGTAIGVIFLLLSGIHFRRGRGFATWSLMICMWLTITSMGFCYILSFLATTADTIDLNPVDPSDLPHYVDPKNGSDWNSYYAAIIVYPLIGWMGLFCLVLVVHICRFIWWIITTVAQYIWWIITTVAQYIWWIITTVAQYIWWIITTVAQYMQSIITTVAQYMQSKMLKMSSHDEIMNV